MRDKLGRNYYEGEIRLWKNARKQNSVAVLVENKSDRLFYQKFFNSNVSFFPVDGFENVINIITIIEKEIAFIIGIIDADFRNITNQKYSSSNIFFTDNHDLEMMTINSQAFNEVLNYHSDKELVNLFEQYHQTSIKKYILNLSKEIGLIRYINHTENLSLTFRTFSKGNYIYLDYSKFIDEKKLNLNHEKLLKIIENKSQKLNYFSINQEVTKKLDALSKIEFNLLDICNGHDFINIFSLALRKVIGKKSISSQDLESYLIVAYRNEDFIKTTLFSNFVKWENENFPYKFLNKHNYEPVIGKN